MDLHGPRLSAFRSISLHVMMTLLFFMNFSQPTTTANPFGNETDRLALLKFKESIPTDPHGSLNSWNDSSHFCSWYGVTCSTSHQRVAALNLQGSDLQGTISPYIGNLSFLRFINLRNNSFSGKIPQQIDHLFRLQHLNLSDNKLEGEIPSNLTHCPELSILSLRSNRLMGKIPPDLGLLMKLLTLNLGTNNLTGGIPPSLGNLSSITQLSLAYNNLVGNVPEQIGQLKSLSFFAIGPNNLSGMIPFSLFNISSMNTISLTDNEFEGSIPPDIGFNMPNLQNIGIGGNQFSGKIPASFSNATQLQILDITENNFEGQVPASFGNLPDLRWLGLSTNNLGNYSANDLGFITSLTNCSNLEILDLSLNYFGGVLPNSVANLSTHLTKLYLGVNQISGMIPATLENLNNLIVLGMQANLFTGFIPSSVGKFQKLQILALDGNGLFGQIPSSIGNLTQLFQLFLSENELEGRIPSSVGDCENLQYLDISENRLSGDIPPQVIGLSSLSVLLNLSHNSLTGSLPVGVGRLKNIYALDVSRNNLTGEIPETIGDCLSLEFLYLQGNLFQGIIPSSLASLNGLQRLDLSQNNLSGQIPKDLQRLPFLLYLNLSFNSLGGEVPKDGAFRNTRTISLLGNSKLCGGFSELQLPACPIEGSEQRKSHVFKQKFPIALVVGCCLVLSFLLAFYWSKKPEKKTPVAASSINFLSKVSYEMLYQATSGFLPSTLIGSGSFGSVYKGILDSQENVVAIKVLSLQQKGASKSFMAECNALRNIQHRNLVKILTCCSSMDHNGNEFKALVFEYMSNGSLEEWLHRENQSRSLNLHQRLNIAVDVASALYYLHDHCEQPIIHCDLKPSNVLLDDDMIAHVGDFGLARLISTTTNNSSETQSSTFGIRGTIGYVAPEYAVGVEPSRQGDIYSYGILVLEMFTGRRPTVEMFEDGFNLHNFVKMAIPEKIMQIVDPALLAAVEEEAPAATEGKGNNINDIEKLSKMKQYVSKCILPVLQIGLACSEESPKHRMNMQDVTRELHHIQNAFIGLQIRRERPRTS